MQNRTGVSLSQALMERSRRSPERKAIVFMDAAGQTAEQTDGELAAGVRRYAQTLKDSGVGAADRVLLICEQGLEMTAGFLAINLIGAVAVPLKYPDRDSEFEFIEHIAADCEPAAVLTNSGRVRVLQEAFGRFAPLVSLPVLGGAAGRAWPDEPVYGELALIQYTSGSTGLPKGVMVTNDSLCANMRASIKLFDYKPWSVMVSWLPFHHDMGLILGLMQGIFGGYLVVLMPPEVIGVNPMLWFRAVTRYRGTHLVAPNFAYELMTRMLNEQPDERIDLSSVVSAACGSEPVNINTMLQCDCIGRRFGLRPGCMVPGYGLAEATLVVSCTGAGDAVHWLCLDRHLLKQQRVKILSEGILDGERHPEMELNPDEIYLIGNGKVVGGHDLSIRDSSGRRLGPGEIGEICFAGPSLAQGYWRRPEDTARTFVRDSDGSLYLKTGDLGFLSDRGELYITGRLKDLIIIHGMNFHPQDIEQTGFNAHPDFVVDGAAAFSVDGPRGEQLALVQEIKTAPASEAEAWAAAASEAIGRVFGIPLETVVFVRAGEIPRTNSGKIQRQAARAAFLNDTLAGVLAVRGASQGGGAGAAESREALTAYLIGLTAAACQLEPAAVQTDRSFMEMGVSSMEILHIQDRLEAVLQRPVPASVFFNYNTIDALSAYLWQMYSGEDRAAAAVPDGDPASLSETALQQLLEKELEGLK